MMTKLVLVLVSLLAFASFALASGVADDSSEEGSATEMGEALGLYPEYFQFDTIAQMEELSGIGITKFNEAPGLAEQVARGELPPVHDRLPAEPLVIVRNEIGKYGGTLRMAHNGTSTAVIQAVNKFMEQMPYTYDPDYNRVGPNILLESELRSGGREYIWRLRKGMRWSDGAPMTADDYLFWYEAVAMNKDLSPQGINSFKVKGTMGKMEKIDDYNVKITFAAPFGYFPEQICLFRPPPFAPKHYLKQFHPDYATEAELNKTMKDEGFTDWLSMWTSMRTWWAVENPDMPNIRPWIMQTDGRAPVNTMIRNPYFWKVDTAGNQLPYIDRVESVLVGDQEGYKLKVIAGDVDYVFGPQLGQTAETFSLLKGYETEGNYRLISSRGAINNQGTVRVNMAHEDPVVREIFQEKDFRIALSIGLDRDEINEVVHRGSYFPSQVGPNNDWGWSDYFKQYTQYDPAEANRLLDGLGLNWNGSKTQRLRPDGKSMELVMFVYTARGPYMVEMAEMYKQYWADLGISVTLKPYGEGVWGKLIAESEWHLSFSQAFGGQRGFPTTSRGEIIPLSANYTVTPAWGKWIVTGGKEGVEPPDDVKRLAEIPGEFMQEPDQAKRDEIEAEIFNIHMDNMWVIGGMNENPNMRFSTFSNRVKNRVGTVWATYHHVASSWYLEE